MYDLIIPKESLDSLINEILKNLEMQMLRTTSIPKERLETNNLPKLGDVSGKCLTKLRYKII